MAKENENQKYDPEIEKQAIAAEESYKRANGHYRESSAYNKAQEEEAARKAAAKAEHRKAASQGVRRDLNGKVLGPYSMTHSTFKDAEEQAKFKKDGTIPSDNFVRKNWNKVLTTHKAYGSKDEVSGRPGLVNVDETTYQDPNGTATKNVKDSNPNAGGYIGDTGYDRYENGKTVEYDSKGNRIKK